MASRLHACSVCGAATGVGRYVGPQVGQKLVGAVGSKITLTVRKGGSTGPEADVVLEREAVPVKPKGPSRAHAPRMHFSSNAFPAAPRLHYAPAAAARGTQGCTAAPARAPKPARIPPRLAAQDGPSGGGLFSGTSGPKPPPALWLAIDGMREGGRRSVVVRPTNPRLRAV